MADEVKPLWNISSPVNFVFLALLMLFAMAAIGLSLLELFGLPLIFSTNTLAEIQKLPTAPGFTIAFDDATIAGSTQQIADSPVVAPVTITTPPLTRDSTLKVAVAANGKVVAATDCLEEDTLFAYVGQTTTACNVTMPYSYQSSESIAFYGILIDESTDTRLATTPARFNADWTPYEANFWNASFIILLLTIGSFVILVIPIALAMMYFSTRIHHTTEYAGEYSLKSLFIPFSGAKTLHQKFQAFIASPLLWLVELIGIGIILLYLALNAQPWQSGTAAFAFLISGVLSFITPFLWVALVWFADYKEREPLRIIISLFLWGGLACLMSIGINSIVGEVFAVLGLAAFTASASAPLVEELFKGSGLAVASFHHEYDDMVDGIVYGFVIGMGFSFVEDWLYLLNNPMGTDVTGWFTVFILRSFAFSANHGVFTAFTGAIIGLLKQYHFKYATLGLIIAIIPGMILHAIHNSGAIWMTFLGGAGGILYCCILIPVFDYGGLIIIALLMLVGVLLMNKKDAGTAIPKPAPASPTITPATPAPAAETKTVPPAGAKTASPPAAKAPRARKK